LQRERVETERQADGQRNRSLEQADCDEAPEVRS
jgi:hypothetical protein